MYIVQLLLQGCLNEFELVARGWWMIFEKWNTVYVCMIRRMFERVGIDYERSKFSFNEFEGSLIKKFILMVQRIRRISCLRKKLFFFL